MAVFRIIPAGDIELGPDGDFVYAEGPEYIRIRLAARFQFYRGEYFLDTRQGIPYYRDALGRKSPDLNVLRSTFREVILTTPGVISLKSFSLTFDPAERIITFNFHAIVKGGEVKVTERDPDFIVGAAA